MFQNSPSLADHFSSLADILCNHSFQIDSNDTPHVPTATNTNPLSSSKAAAAYKQSLYNSVTELINTSGTESLLPDADTLVFPLVQMGQYGIRQDEQVTQQLLGGVREGESVCLATGYFNPPSEYVQAILNSRGQYRILAAAPEVSRDTVNTLLKIELVVLTTCIYVGYWFPWC